LPPLAPAVEALAAGGIAVRRPAASERTAVIDWMRAHGSPGWADECAAAFARQPIACFVAVDVDQTGTLGGFPEPPATTPLGEAQLRQREGEALCGVACYDAACRNFFGPELVAPDRRGRGIGRALLLSALHAMRADGYAYAIIGWAASVDFYQRAVGAVVIDGSTPGIYPRPFIA
ncbi:MAG: GNAT family N-acetyltransferase, partial [Verrucomicrobiota bacterium]